MSTPKPKQAAKASKKQLDMLVKKMVALNKAQPLIVKADEKGVVSVDRPIVGTKSAVRGALGANPFRTRLYIVAAVQTSSSGSPFTTVQQANLAVTGEWNQFAVVFDEVKCHEVAATVWARCAGTVANTLCIVTWDADDTTPLASVQAGAAASKKTGPHSLYIPGGTDGVVGAHTLAMKVRSGKLSGEGFPDESSGTPVSYPVRGAWVATTASTAIVGFFKPYMEAVTSQTWQFRIMMEFDVVFRLRS